MKNRKSGATIMLFLLALLTAFFVNIAAAAPSKDDPAKRGKRLYNQYCMQCHGTEGKGDGDRYFNEKLDPQPRVHANGSYMNRIPDMRLFRVIKYGGRSINFSHIMPQWQHIFKDDDIVDLVAHIRTLADQPFVLGSVSMNCMLPPPGREAKHGKSR